MNIYFGPVKPKPVLELAQTLLCTPMFGNMFFQETSAFGQNYFFGGEGGEGSSEIP